MAQGNEWKNDELVVYLSGLKFPFMTDDLLKSFYNHKNIFLLFAKGGGLKDFDMIVKLCAEKPYTLLSNDSGKIARALMQKYQAGT